MTSGMRARRLMALLFAVFVVTLAYGITLPLLPLLVSRELGSGTNVGLHTGLIAGVYAVALFLFAPLWGRWSDNGNRRGNLVLGLCGFGFVHARRPRASRTWFAATRTDRSGSLAK